MEQTQGGNVCHYKRNCEVEVKGSRRTSQNVFLFLLLVITLVSTSASQSVVNYPGAGVFRAGKLWDSFLPQNGGPYYQETADFLTKELLRIGNFDRAWSTPTHMWPGGWNVGPFWEKGMVMTEFNPDASWNPPLINGVTNPSYYSVAGSSYAFASYRSTLLGANNALRNYKTETRWVDSLRRDEAIYEAGWPTTIGIDVRLKIRQFTLNWNNLDDFIVVEMTLINTGAIDMNADGVAERTNNVIRALTLLSHAEFMCSYSLNRAAGRGNVFGATRGLGYVGDNDPKGNPWDIMVAFPGESASNSRDMGLNDWPSKSYAEVWNGWSWLAVKRGGSNDSIANLPDKNTLYGSHPIGLGAQRGWYTSGGQARFLGIGPPPSNPDITHTVAMGTWYVDGGKSRTQNAINRAPDMHFFQSGTAGNPTTFVPLTSPGRPSGDRKLFSEESPTNAFEVNHYEDWGKGFTAAGNFDGDMYSGIGPFTLAVGETVTVAWVEASGYRFRGLANAIAAARWAYEHNFQLPRLPAVPDMLVEPTSTTAKIFWNNTAQSHANFAGYKIYRVSSDDSIAWLQEGMRGMDKYWMNNFPGPTPDSLLQPVNPLFTGLTNKAAANSWGPYKLIARIPVQNLPAFQDSSHEGFSYSYVDSGIHAGIETWYYVAAYIDEYHDLGSSYAGYNSPTTNFIETSNLNRNGASGLWWKTYPFATLSPNYPVSPEERKRIGGPVQTSTTGVSNNGDTTPFETSLDQNYPNPFNPSTKIKFRIAHAGLVSLKVFDVLGREVTTLMNDQMKPGSYEREFDASGMASGVYLYKLQTGSFIEARKLLLLK